MEYKRLTNSNPDEYNPEIDFCSDCKYYGEPNGCNRPNGTCDNYDRFLETYNRLKEHEDKIKNRTMIELPCEIKDIREITVAYKDYGNPLFAIVRYYCQQNKPYKILEYHIVGKELISGKDKRVWEWYPSMNFSLIEDGFTSKEQAEAKLKELKDKEQ